MARGIDCDVDCAAKADCLIKEGYHFVCRYIKDHPSHLTRAEAVTLSKAGLWVVAVYENGSPTDAGYFSQAKGISDGQKAYDYMHGQLQAPAGSPIYFAVDYDASVADIAGPISAYFDGIHQAFMNVSSGHPIYPIGVYGSGLVCETLKSRTNVSYAWLSESMGWRGSRFYTGWNLKQSVAAGPVCGLSVDLDESNGHGGGWKVF